MLSPIDQVMDQMDEEGRIVFQGTLIAGYSPRQALFNAFGFDCSDNVDCSPNIDNWLSTLFKDARTAELFLSTPQTEIEAAFWRRWEGV